MNPINNTPSTRQEEEAPAPTRPHPVQSTTHSLQAHDRKDMLVRGVREVLSFDETNVRLVTTAGIVNLEGRDLRIHTLNTKDGIVAVTGILDGVLYENEESITTSVSQSGKRRFGRSR